MILHIGSNDSLTKTSDEILLEIENLKNYVLQVLPKLNIIISCPIVRFDNYEANYTLRRLDSKLKQTKDIIMNDNIDRSCVGKRGLHLNAKGSSTLAANYISRMKHL